MVPRIAVTVPAMAAALKVAAMAPGYGAPQGGGYGPGYGAPQGGGYGPGLWWASGWWLRSRLWAAPPGGGYGPGYGGPGDYGPDDRDDRDRSSSGSGFNPMKSMTNPMKNMPNPMKMFGGGNNRD